MSDTPKTDAEEYSGIGDVGFDYVKSEFARQLERELNQEVKERDEARECLLEVLQNSEFSEWVGVTTWHRWRKAAGLDAGEAK